MSSIKTFCVRWIALIALTGAVLIPVSRATAEQAPHPTTQQEASPAR
jgi:hypothetical protein